jgi:potassium efflux system protein
MERSMTAGIGRAPLWLLVGAWTLASAWPAPAQEAAAPAPPEPAAASGSARLPIPEAEVPSRADEVFEDLPRIEALLEPSSRVRAIESAEARLRADLMDRRAELDRIDPDRVSVRRLDDLRDGWSEARSRLEDWMSRLEDRWKTVQDEQAELQATTAQWQATRRAAEAGGAPPELLRRIDEVLARLAEVQTGARRRADALADVMDRVARERESATLALGRLDTMQERAKRRLLVRDAPPLWDVAGWVTGQDLRHDAVETADEWENTLRRYAAERQGTLYAHAALLLVVLLLTLALRGRSRAWPAPDPDRDGARFLASRPVATALLFTLAVATFTLERPVGPVRDLGGLLGIAAVVRLGAGFVPRAWRGPLYAVVALTVLDRLWPLAPEGSPLQRLLLLLVIVPAAAGATLWVRRRRRAAVPAGPSGRWAAATTTGLTLASTILAVSLLAVVLGWTSLAGYLTTGTVVAAFTAFAWLIVRGAVLALLPLVTRGAAGRALLSLRRHEAAFLRGATAVVTALVVVVWAVEVLRRFQVFDPMVERLSAALSASVAVGGLSLSAGHVLAAVAILLATWLAARAVRLVLSEELLPRLPLPAGADHSVLTLANYSVLGLGVLAAAAAAGLSGTQLTVVFGALGVGVGFGLQTIVNNFVSGLILIFERPIKVGDRVQTVDHFGLITHIGIRASTLRTFDGAEVMIPNGELIARDVINWTRSDSLRRVEVLVGVAYGTDPGRVLRILLEVAKAHPRVLAEPEPQAFMIRFGDSSLDFRLLAWVRADEFLEVTSDLNVGVDAALKDAGISIPFPQRDLHLRSVDGAAARAFVGPPPGANPDDD